MKLLCQKNISIAIAAMSLSLSITYLTLAIIGAFRNFSPVPFWDMWDGYVFFYTRLLDHDYSAWWSLHVNHRTVLSNILFWMDFKFFGGKIVSLIVANYLLLSLIACCFFAVIRNLFFEQNERFISYSVFFIVFSILFSWIQYENLVWGFQSSMFAAQFFPMAAFFLFCYAFKKEYRFPVFLTLSVLMGMISAFTMVNGIIVLPIILFLSFRYKLGLNRILPICGISAAVIIVYFFRYKNPDGQGDVIRAISTDPIGVLKYMSVYWGAPVRYAFQNCDRVVVMTFGAAIILYSMFFVIILIRKKAIGIEHALMAVLIYTMTTSFATAGGRLIHGYDQAMSSRYMTTVLVGWCAVGTLGTWWIYTRRPKWLISACCAFLCVPLILLNYQFRANINVEGILFNKLVAALAIELGVEDQKQIEYVFPWPKVCFTLAEKAIERHLSIFSHPAIRGAHKRIGEHREGHECNEGRGGIDSILPIKKEEKYLKVTGWIFDQKTLKVPIALDFVDSDGIIIGHAITGDPHHVITDEKTGTTDIRGFIGYALADKLGDQTWLFGIQPECRIETSGAKDIGIKLLDDDSHE